MVKINRMFVIQLIRRLEEKFRIEKDFLDKLDTEIGDGDHGTNMELSFVEMRQVLTQTNKDDFGSILKNMGDTFLRVGGGIGTFLYGSSLNEASKKLSGKANLDMKDFKQILKDMGEEIKELGEVATGQKTMYDVLDAAVQNLFSHQENNIISHLEVLENMISAADYAMLETKNMVAKKGRASYFGEKTLGHIDPGAYSMYLILLTIYEFYKDEMISDLLKTSNYKFDI